MQFTQNYSKKLWNRENGCIISLKARFSQRSLISAGRQLKRVLLKLSYKHLNFIIMKTIASFFTVLFLSLLFMAAGTPRVITGTVVDENGYALIGASVTEKGTPNGTVTDTYGKYSITVGNNAAILIFSYIGMETQEVVIGSGNTIHVQMKPSAVAMEEVAITGSVQDKLSSNATIRPMMPGRHGRKSMEYAAVSAYGVTLPRTGTPKGMPRSVKTDLRMCCTIRSPPSRSTLTAPPMRMCAGSSTWDKNRLLMQFESRR
jgi:hypothetical protein